MSSDQDNLEDGVFHGFRSLYGADCVDYPKKERMYRDYILPPGVQTYGRMFTVWRTLDNIDINRENIPERIINNDYDLIIFGSIHRSYELFKRFKPYLKKNKTILLDGEDHVRPKLGARGFLYFKRELVPKMRYYYTYKLTPRFIYNHLPPPKSMRPTAFAIPKEKITWDIARESKKSLLPLHIVDEEVRLSDLVPQDADTGYKFDTEEEYYANLREAKFGITVKRGGWDCLRHYEIAANGAVICIRDLASKSPYCAPHGLDASNAIIYSSVDDLKHQIKNMSDGEYDRILEQGYKWIERQTSEYRAKEILDVAKTYFQK